MLNELIDELKTLLQNVGDFLIKQDVKVSYHKTINDLLTENDLSVERYIVSNLKEKFPLVNIISEETYSSSKLKGISVVIDPIDGTCNFANHLDLFGIQVAIFDEWELTSALMYFPLRKELVYGVKGKGVYINEKKIEVDINKNAKDSILLISDYYPNIDIPMDRQFELVKELQSVFLKTRHLGAACIDFVTLIKSQAVAYITYYHHIWDIAPGLMLIKELGFVFKHISGEKYKFKTPGLVVANNEENLNKILATYKKLSNK